MSGFRSLGFEELEQRLALSVTVSVNASQTVRQVADNLLGVNVEFTDSLVDTPQTVQMAANAGFTMIRFPGGSESDTWHFTDPTTYAGEGTAATMAGLAQSLNAGSIVTLDYGSGSPQEAAALLAYLDGSVNNITPIGFGEQWNTSTNRWVNVDWKTAGWWAGLRAATPLAQDDGFNFLRIGQSAPFNVHYFEVGNEEYGSWETDFHGQGGDLGKQHDPATYATFAKQFSVYAALIAPTISIGIDTGDSNPTAYDGWTTDVLKLGAAEGFVPGFLSDHLYIQTPGDESDSYLLTRTVSDPGSGWDWADRAAQYEAILLSTVGAAAGSVELLATEFGSVFDDPGKQTTSLVGGLFLADALGSLLETGYDGADVWVLHDVWLTDDNNSSGLYGWRQGGDYGLLGNSDVTDLPATGPNVPYATYFAEQLVSKIIQPGGTVVPAASTNPNLSVYAVREADGDLELLVINKDSTNSQTGPFNLTGFLPQGTANVWQYGEAQDTAQSHTTDGSSALANSVATLSLNGSTFSFSFPAYSMTVLDLPAARPVVNLGGTGGNIAVTFVRGSGGVPIVGTNSLTVTDTNSSNLVGATVALDSLPDGAAESLAVANVGANNLVIGTKITAVYANGVLTLSGSDTLADYQLVLRTLVYNDTASSLNLSTRAITVVVDDGTQISSPVTSSVTMDEAPTVVGAFVSGGNAWSSYLSVLNGTGLGFELADGGNQLNTLPWLNITQISIAFSEPVNIGLSSLTLDYYSPQILNNATLASLGFSYNAATFVATWQFPDLAANKYLLNLAASSVSDSLLTPLDGDWTTGASTFAIGSGDGTPGGDFNFYFDVLPGDANSSGAVTNTDVVQTKLQVGTPSNSTNYAYDVNGSGSITNTDVVIEKLLVGNNMINFTSPLLPPESLPFIPLPNLWPSPAALTAGPSAAPLAIAAPADDSQSGSYAAVMSAAPGLAAPAIAPVASLPLVAAAGTGTTLSFSVAAPIPASPPASPPGSSTAPIADNAAMVLLPPAPPVPPSTVVTGPVVAAPQSETIAAAATITPTTPPPSGADGAALPRSVFLDDELASTSAADGTPALSPFSGPRVSATQPNVPVAAAGMAWFAARTDEWIGGQIEPRPPAVALDAVLDGWSTHASRLPHFRSPLDPRRLSAN